MSKDFEFYTEVDGWLNDDGLRVMTIEHANRLLNKRGTTIYGYHGRHDKDVAYDTVKGCPDQTEALAICPRPIEKEEPECEGCKLIGMYKRDNIFVFTINFCPKCGRDLK